MKTKAVSTAICALSLLMMCTSPLASMATDEMQKCFVAASEKYNIDPRLLLAIAEKESNFNPLAKGQNADGSFDLGVMQINSRWLPQLKQFGINAADLYQPCVNIDIGTWILMDNIRRLGLSWNAVGAYNASSISKRIPYVLDVKKRLEKYNTFSFSCCSLGVE